MAGKFTEHTVRLPDGVDIFYTDSGPVYDCSDYTTLILLHGGAFNGDGLYRLHTHAHSNNLRVILPSRRDYRGSTPYSDAELDDLNQGRKAFIDKLALHDAWLIEHFIKQGIPKLCDQRKSGGVVLMGWSFGAATALALLSDPDVIPPTLYETIEPYLLGIVLDDPPYTILGYPDPPRDDLFDPWCDPDAKSLEDLFDGFQHHVGSYYDHCDVGSFSSTGLDVRKRAQRSTLDEWSQEQRLRWFEKSAAARSEKPMTDPPMQSVLKNLTHSALFNERLTTTFFPRVNIFHLTAANTVWSCMWGFMETLRRYKEAKGEGKVLRPTRFRFLEEGNHFLHWEYPNELLETVMKGVVS